MKTKCTGLMGRIFGHKWEYVRWVDHVDGSYIRIQKRHSLKAVATIKIMNDIEHVGVGLLCLLCGAVTGEKK